MLQPVPCGMHDARSMSTSIRLVKSMDELRWFVRLTVRPWRRYRDALDRGVHSSQSKWDGPAKDHGGAHSTSEHPLHARVQCIA